MKNPDPSLCEQYAAHCADSSKHPVSPVSIVHQPQPRRENIADSYSLDNHLDAMLCLTKPQKPGEDTAANAMGRANRKAPCAPSLGDDNPTITTVSAYLLPFTYSRPQFLCGCVGYHDGLPRASL